MHNAIKSLESLREILTTSSRILCLYSGGLDGTYLLWWLSKQVSCKVLALTVDVGGDELLPNVEQICRHFNVHHLVLDRQKEFVQDFVVHSIAAQAHYLGGHPICASLSRPLMAKAAVESAEQHGMNVILHTADRSQNSLRRFNGALTSLGFKGSFGSPFELTRISREDKRKALRDLEVVHLDERIYSIDTNLWGREFEYGELDDPEHIRIPEHLYRWTSGSHSSTADQLKVSFQQGIPVELDGTPTSLMSLISAIQIKAGQYGIGRYVGLEEIEGGLKVQEIREMPAACILFDAYRRLESACVAAECIREKMHIEQLWVREAVEGRWYGHLREAAQAFIKNIAGRVTGSVEYSLSSKGFNVRSINARNHLYIRDRSSL